MVKEKVELTVSLNQETINRWHALAKRRYGDDSQESLNKVAEDAYKWLLNRWDAGYYGFYDWFWTRVAYCPLKRLAAIGRSKLIFGRYFSE